MKVRVKKRKPPTREEWKGFRRNEINFLGGAVRKRVRPECRGKGGKMCREEERTKVEEKTSTQNEGENLLESTTAAS